MWALGEWPGIINVCLLYIEHSPTNDIIILRGEFHGKKMTLTIDDDVYFGLLYKIGKREMGKFISGLARPYALEGGIEAGYQAMARDEERETEAIEWINALIGDDDK
jgi:hypothetical protein